MTLLSKVKQFVDTSFGKKEKHFERTLYWVKKLNPEADEALQIAAYAHDIGRAESLKDELEKIKSTKDGFLDQKMLDKHQKLSAKIITDFLKKEKADPMLIKRVRHLVSAHESGGDKEQNILKDADSISYFETNIKFFAKKFVKIFGKEKIKQKFDWMYHRITNPVTKKNIKQLYNKAVQNLEKEKF